MTEYAPDAIKRLFDTIHNGMPQAILGGILGDQNHDYGYHRGRNYVAAGDYSTQLPEDQQGDGEAASALDLSWSDAASHYTASRRLLDAANDSRMAAARSFFGSTDGHTVCGYDYAGGYPVTSDDSHLWHVHLSILRKYANDYDALAPIAEVVTGGAATSGGDWLDMASMEDVKTAVRAVLNEGTAQGQKNWAGTCKATLGTAQSLVNQVNALKGQLAEVERTLLAAINSEG